jgi:chromate reductase
MKILGICGSLRRESFNRKLLRAAMEMLPEGHTIDVFDLAPIPLYNNDVYELGFPPPVVAFREAVRGADALLIATPEYNYSVPGVLKNAIDWASRAPDQPFSGKPMAMMGASSGLSGTMRSQNHLRQVALGVNLLVLTRPEVMVRTAADKFDASGRLTDEKTRQFVKSLVEGLIAWTARLSARA